MQVKGVQVEDIKMSIGHLLQKIRDIESQGREMLASSAMEYGPKVNDVVDHIFSRINSLYLSLKTPLGEFYNKHCGAEIHDYIPGMRAALEAVKDSLHSSLPAQAEKWPMITFMACAIFCFFASALMHLLWVRCLKTCHTTHNLDLSGIAIMIFGSAFGFIHYVFQCDTHSYNTYFYLQVGSMLCVLVCINCKLFNNTKYEFLKTFLFIFQALISAVAVIHWRINEYPTFTKQQERHAELC